MRGAAELAQKSVSDGKNGLSSNAYQNRGIDAGMALREGGRGVITIRRHNGGGAMSEQSFENHTKFIPSYHFFALPVFVINFAWAVYRLWKLGISFEGILGVILAAAFVVLAFRARVFALAVQDRVIRLEEKLRYERVLPADLRPRIGEFELAQFVSLRFACDAELPALARKVLDEKLTKRKAIKQLIKNWKPDYLRA
jgi:hypothetical protein